jgi:hypothetical protein
MKAKSENFEQETKKKNFEKGDQVHDNGSGKLSHKGKEGNFEAIEETEVWEESDDTLLHQSSLIKWKHPIQEKKKISDIQLDNI